MEMQYLLFKAGKDTFAIDAFAVQKIHMPVPVTRLPHVADYISGIVNIEGEVMPQVDLCKLLRLAAGATGELLVINIEGQQLALLVGSTLEKVAVDDQQINTFSTLDDSHDEQQIGDNSFHSGQDISADHISSELLINGHTALILNAGSLLRLIRPAPVAEGESGLTLQRNALSDAAQTQDSKSGYLTFRLGKETLALPLLQLMEVVEISQLTQVPGAPLFIAGLAVLRTQPLLVVNLASMLELQQGNDLETKRVLIVQYEASWIGLLVDQVFGIQYFSDSQIIKETSSISFIDAYMIDNLQKINLLLDLKSLLQSNYANVISQYLPRAEKAAKIMQAETVKMLKVLIGREAFAIPIEYVRQITEFKSYAKIQESTKGIIGTVDINGNIIPVVNIASQLNIGAVSNLEQWVVVACDAEQWALCVSKATALFDLQVDKIDYSASNRQSVKGISSYKGELISILDFLWLKTDGKSA